MANYLYNGVELPQLPEWDRERYPCALIKQGSKYIELCVFKGLDGWGIYSYTASGYSHSYPAIFLSESGWHKSQLIDGAWAKMGEYITEKISLGDNGTTEPVYQMWSNVDIAHKDTGELLLAASDPIPVGTAPVLDPLSLWLGWKAGNWVARQRGKKKTPVAYLYNGVRLPDINTVWTDEMKALYPYAYMYEVAGFGAYTIIFASFEMYKDGKQIFAKTAGEAIYAMYMPGAYDDWESDGIAQEVKENELMFDEEAEVQVFTAVSWTSHDILNADGTIYLAASEPVPVYE